MTPQMQEALLQVSNYFHPEPSRVIARVLQTLSRHYGGAMAMLNLRDGDRLTFRAMVNPHPELAHVTTVTLTDAY